MPADSVSIRIYSGIARFPCDSMAFLYYVNLYRPVCSPLDPRLCFDPCSFPPFSFHRTETTTVTGKRSVYYFLFDKIISRMRHADLLYSCCLNVCRIIQPPGGTASNIFASDSYHSNGRRRTDDVISTAANIFGHDALDAEASARLNFFLYLKNVK